MGLTHGTTTGYGYYKCRCDPCREAMLAYQRQRAAAKKAGTWQPGRTVKERTPCSGPECDRLARYLQPQPLCGGHVQQVWRGVPLTPLRRYRDTKDGKKECRLCGEILPVESFYWQNNTKRQSQCIPCAAIYNRMLRYSLTYDEVKRLMDEPCAGCGVALEGRELFVDHDHETGRVRGTLCVRCNTVLMDHMTPEILRRLADYLEQ